MPQATAGLDLTALREELVHHAPLRRVLGEDGGLYVDRPLPFLCMYRSRSDRADDAAARLVTSQAAYLIVPDDRQVQAEAEVLVQRIAQAMTERFGGFLLLELWPGKPWKQGREVEPYTLRPGFRILAPETDALAETVDTLHAALSRIFIHKQQADVQITWTEEPAPPDLAPLNPGRDDSGKRSFVLGLEVDSVYRDRKKGGIFPFLYEQLRRDLSGALKRALFRFARAHTAYEPGHYLALGRRHLDRITLEVDRQLAAVDESLRFLLQVTPVNARAAWRRFREDDFQNAPVFHYRPLFVDPELLKRSLFELPIEQVEDPALAWLFREKQEELDRKITMLRDRDTRRFFFGSLQLFGEVDEELLDLAHNVLAYLPPQQDRFTGDVLDAQAFARLARAAFDRYRGDYPGFPETPQIRADIPPGLLVSRGELLIGRGTIVPVERADALIQHEVGTHVLTYCNGRAQPLRLFHAGLAGYEALQEGLAVLAEYLAGGLTPGRLRVLAARVVAAQRLIEGASFTEVFHGLVESRGFDPETAFTIAMRAFRGGGFVKDVIYLRGLRDLTRHLQAGGSLEKLLVGKIALHHVPLIEELEHRGLLKPVPLRPHYMDDQHARLRLERIVDGLPFAQLLEELRT